MDPKSVKQPKQEYFSRFMMTKAEGDSWTEFLQLMERLDVGFGHLEWALWGLPK